MTLSDFKRALLIGTVSFVAFWAWYLVVNSFLIVFILNRYNISTSTVQMVADFIGFILPAFILIIFFIRLAMLECPRCSKVLSLVLIALCMFAEFQFRFENKWIYTYISNRGIIGYVTAPVLDLIIADIFTSLMCISIFILLHFFKLFNCNMIFYVCITAIGHLMNKFMSVTIDYL